MLEQQFEEIVLGAVNDLLLVVVVDLLAVVLGQRLEAFAAHKQDAHLGQLLAGRDEAGLFEELFELFLPSDGWMDKCW